MWDTLGNIILKMFSRWTDRPRITLEVRELKYYLFQNKPDSRVVAIVLDPSAYIGDVEFSHHGRPTTVKDVRLCVNNGLGIEATRFKPIRLNDGDYVKEHLLFPVDEKQAVKEGTFEIQVVDADNKVHKCGGYFPIIRSDRHALKG